MKYLLLSGVVVFYLYGCATTPVPLSEARQAPADRVLAFQSIDGEKSATLTVIRDEGFTGGGCYYALYINKVLSA